jgi:medium-chain acyl-[acyl-carrier-protein] hydrolase
MTTPFQNQSSTYQGEWVLRWPVTNQPKLRMFCFPFAGGGAYNYKPWQQLLPPDIEVCAIQLPGRESRRAEKPLTSMSELMPILARSIEPLMTVPFFFFGHSMGGLMSFELCRYLRRQNELLPSDLFISATCAPQLSSHKRFLHLMSDLELIQEMSRYGGTPKEVLEDKDMIEMMLPLLRADCALFETCDYVPETPVDIPITVFGGAQDERATEEELRAWEAQTTAAFSLRMFPGAHFFLKEVQQRNNMLQHIVSHYMLH